jgi:thiol-disulfide isomerase/thioredoxin
VTAVLVVCRLVLALVFSAAGSAKLVDPEGTREALAAFGFPRQLVGRVAVVLPVIELVVAGGLLAPVLSRWAAAAAFGLLIVFGAGIANSLLHGRRPVCHCFGQLSTSPASWTIFGRNVVLAAAAAFVAIATSTGREPTWARYMLIAALVALAAALALLLASRRLPWVSLRRLEERIAGRPQLLAAVRGAMRIAKLAGMSGDEPRGLPLGSRAPDFRIRHRNGGRVTLASLLTGKPAVLVFGDSSCRPCVALMPTVIRWQREHGDRLTIAIITSGSLEEELAAASTDGLENVLAQDNREVADAYEADVTPSAVLVNADGRIASRLAVGEVRIQALVESLSVRPVREDSARPSQRSPGR